ncbi:MAG: LemA family protein [Lysobacterales bacterium]
MLSWGFALLIFVALGAAVWLFNGLVRSRNLVASAWADIDVQLQRRHDLVPRLVKVVKAAASHEQQTLESVIATRDAAVRASQVSDKGQREEALQESINQLLMLVEDYPDLKAGDNYSELSHDLVDIEDKLQYARRFYNGATREYNTRVERFPDQLVASSFGFSQAQYFQAQADARAPAEVNLQ